MVVRNNGDALGLRPGLRWVCDLFDRDVLASVNYVSNLNIKFLRGGTKTTKNIAFTVIDSGSYEICVRKALDAYRNVFIPSPTTSSPE